MKKGVIALKLLAEQMRFEYHTVRVWLGIGIGLTMFLISVQQFMEFVKLRGEPVNLMDCFLYGGGRAAEQYVGCAWILVLNV